MKSGEQDITSLSTLKQIAETRGDCIVLVDHDRDILVGSATTKDKVDDNKHIHDFDACIPNDGDLIIVNIAKKIQNSLKIPNKKHKVPIITILVSVKYSPSSPYLISASFVSS